MNGASALPTIAGRAPAQLPTPYANRPTAEIVTSPAVEVATSPGTDGVTDMPTSLPGNPEGTGLLNYRLDGRPADGPPAPKGQMLDLRG